ncbi:phage tail assembly chaperone [Enterococcus timonensis]|uniref:phage tail assembly chaperone n=1 Tax=Enterococcus timonensis TaxID=1852364 RepID=UPI001F2734BF|nr:phage portal protein [Enterococcus timonensis]
MSKVVDIKSFLITNENETKEVKIERFPEPFVISSLGETENDRLKKANTSTRRSKSGSLVKDLDTDKYGDALLARCVVGPDLKDAELQAFFKTPGDEIATLKAMLRAGEYASLVKEVLEFNGFNEDEEEIKDEVKN